MVCWNDFLCKVCVEWKCEGEVVIVVVIVVVEVCFECFVMILLEICVVDGEFIGIFNLGNKGKVGCVKWNEFKNFVFGGIFVVY